MKGMRQELPAGPPVEDVDEVVEEEEVPDDGEATIEDDIDEVKKSSVCDEAWCE